MGLTAAVIATAAPRERPFLRAMPVFAGAVLASAVVLPLALTPGMPLFLHDWTWSPFSAAVQFTATNLYSAWSAGGIGGPNSAISANVLSWLKPALGVLPTGKAALVAYLWLASFFTAWGMTRLLKRAFGVRTVPAIIGGAIVAFSPFFFSKLAAGQSSYWAAMAAFIWALDAAIASLRTLSLREACLAAVYFALSTIQMQFVVFSFIAIGCLWLSAPSRRSLPQAVLMAAGALTLAFPELLMLWRHGPIVGAGISPPYRYWTASQSLSLHDAFDLFGFAANYPAIALRSPALETSIYCIAIAMSAIGAGFALFMAVRRSPFPFAGVLAIGIVGYVWVTGINGPLAALWNSAFAHSADAAFLRELYHAGILVIVPQVALFVAAIDRIAPQSVSTVAAVVVLAVFALPFEANGLVRTLNFVNVPPSYYAMQKSFSPRLGAALFLPAVRPLATRADQIGGTEGLDWISPTELSLYEYYPSPMMAKAVRDLREGRDAQADSLLRRLGCNAVIVRDDVVSLSWPQPAGTSSRDVPAAGGALVADYGSIQAYTRAASPLVDVAANALPLPTDGAMRKGVTYLDEPGVSPVQIASFVRASRPDPRAGWVDARDAAWDRDVPLNGMQYGLVTFRSDEPIRFPGEGAVDVIVAHGSGAGAAATFGPFRRELLPRGETLRFAGPVVVSEAQEHPVSEHVVPGTIDSLQRQALWSYRAVADLHGRSAIILRQRFDPGWTLTGLHLRVLRHLRADGAFNAWIVEGRGKAPLSIDYQPQKRAFTLIAASSLLWLMLVAGATLGNRNGRLDSLR